MNQQFRSCLVAAIATAMACSVQAQEVASVDKTVNAEKAPGIDQAPSLTANPPKGDGQHQCYARVSVPAEYRTEEVTAELLPETTRFRITPPVFKDGAETVTVSPAFTKITAVQPELEESTQTFTVMRSSSQWVRGSLDSKQPLTKGELLDMQELGVDTKQVAAGTCFYEHFTEATLEDIPTRILGWETQCGAVQQVDHMTGETLCLVDVPAQYENVPTEVVDVPALLTNVEKKAETKDIKVKTLVTEAQKVRKVIPAKYESLDRQRISKPASYSWLKKSDRPAFGAKPTGRTACFVETPEKLVEYKRQVVKTAGRFDAEKIPAETKLKSWCHLRKALSIKRLRNFRPSNVRFR